MKREKIQNDYMFDTKVDNMFINEYMISAPGDFVKLYLVALMYADLDRNIDNQQLAKIVGVDVDDVARCWKYWENLNVVRLEKGEVIFISLKESIYGRKKKEQSSIEKADKFSQEASHILSNNDMRNMFQNLEKIVGRPITGTESDKVIDWMETIGATMEVIVFAFEYCYSRKKTDIRYIEKVVEGWTGRGFKNVKAVEEFLEIADQRHYQYKRVLKALGFFRNPTEEEKRMMDVWFDEEGLSIGKVLDACKKTSGISNPNFNYINSVLLGQKKDQEKGGTGKIQVSRAVVKDYYEYLRNKEEDEANMRHDEVVSGLPVISEYEKKIRDNFSAIAQLAISGTVDKQERIGSLKKENIDLQKQIERALTANGIPIDYMKVHYKCPVCRDTGFLDNGQMCSCYMTRAEEAAEWNK